MTNRPKIPPGFRDATKEGARVAIIGGIGRRIGDADKPVAEAGAPGVGQSKQRRTPAEMSAETAGQATASGAAVPSEPARKPRLRLPKRGTGLSEGSAKAFAVVGAGVSGRRARRAQRA